MILSIIAAVGDDRAIGRNGDLTFRISADLRHFKELTMGFPIIMGRKTFESLPKALPGRRNIVITANSGYQATGIETARSLDEALDLVKGAEKAFIIGGASIYRLAMPLADVLEITHIHATAPDADTFFPEIDPETWHPMPAEILTDEKTGLRYSFTTYTR